jgi:hypothetical protein
MIRRSTENKMTNRFKALLGAATFALSASAMAVTTWNLNPGTNCAGQVASCSTLASSGVSIAGFQTTNILSTTTIVAENIQYYGPGWGAGPSGSQPGHAIDNNGQFEAVMLTFTTGKVNLTGVTTGYVSGDSDLTMLAYTASTTGLSAAQIATNTSITGKTWAQLLTSGWSLVGSYNNASSVSTTSTPNSSLSSYWLIGAYNSLIGGTSTPVGASTNPVDYFKLASVSGCAGTTCSSPTTTPSSVPEPGSLALFGMAFAGLAALRRRKQA